MQGSVSTGDNVLVFGHQAREVSAEFKRSFRGLKVQTLQDV